MTHNMKGHFFNLSEASKQEMDRRPEHYLPYSAVLYVEENGKFILTSPSFYHGMICLFYIAAVMHASGSPELILHVCKENNCICSPDFDTVPIDVYTPE